MDETDKTSKVAEEKPIKHFKLSDFKTTENKQNKGKIHIWHVLTFVFATLFIVALLTKGFSFARNGSATGGAVTELSKENTIIILNDKRCDDCDTAGLISQLKQLFPNSTFKELDYSSAEGKKIYKDNGLTVLPAVLFTENVKNEAGYSNIQSYLEKKGNYLNLRIGSSFDPTKEICGNKIDDDNDGDLDCADSDCKGVFECMEKKTVPTIELFVMSHCPFGTQIEKGMLPVLKLLKDKIDFKLEFVYYAMHGEKELKEQMNQYCIQKEQKDKLIPYLECFLKAGDSASCLKSVNINTAKLDACTKALDEQYNIMEKFKDTSTWLNGRYPRWDPDKEANEKYGVGGSPTLVVNGVKSSSDRDSASLLKAICVGFKDPPSECNESLSSAKPSPGFGFSETASDASSGGCAG